VTTPSAPHVGYFRTLSGRLFILSSVLLAILLTAGLFTELPLFLDLFRKVVRLAWFVSVASLAITAIGRNRRRLLWRVRQRLILSYVFLGFVPVLLVAALALVAGVILYMNVAGYMFHESVRDIGDDVSQAAESAAAEIGRTPGAAAEALVRRYENLSTRYPALSLAVIPLSAGAADPAAGQSTPARPAAPAPAGAPIVAGPWRHGPAPTDAPAWLADSASGFNGVIALPSREAPGEWVLVLRAAVPTRDHRRAVVADLPIDPAVVADIEARSQTRMGQITVPAACGGAPDAAPPGVSRSLTTLFDQTVAFMDCTNWQTGKPDSVSISLAAPIGRLYARMAGTQAALVRASSSDVYLYFLLALAILFLVIQASALVMGALLARSITYAVHELFVGTVQVQAGNFSHRIKIESRDQLGDLAVSWNRMSSFMEHMLHVQRDKQRLDDELRIARDIQKSLLPASPPAVAGMTIADLCEPAREVGGDYYDFFELGPRRLGVMVADVSGKGTSAALYMAELKGLMLALSRREESPRRLLIEANRLLAGHLDNRSFITMTYAVIDLDTRQLTCARAGHTPLIVVSGGRSDVVTPSGMVLGLRLPGAAERFAQVLEEHERAIAPGDVIVLYTDGITEAMNQAGDLFGDDALAGIVAAQHRLDAAGIRERVVRDVRVFVGNAEPHDDMTMIVLKLDESATP